MRFGLLCSTNVDTAEAINSYVELNIEAEALGFTSSFLAEHHFSGWNQVAATLMLQTCVAVRTSTLRLGTGVIVLPWHNPVLLAEQAATLDVLSGGARRPGCRQGISLLGVPGLQRRSAGSRRLLRGGTRPGLQRGERRPASVEQITQRIAWFGNGEVAVARQVYVAYRNTEEHALFGTPDEICVGLLALRNAGVDYVLLNLPGGHRQLHRFASDVAPFAPSAGRCISAPDG